MMEQFYLMELMIHYLWVMTLIIMGLFNMGTNSLLDDLGSII